MKINKYLPFAFLYFFFNSVALPLGLLYTTLLSPIWYLWLIAKGKRHILLKFIAILLPFIVVHLINGVYLISYLKSLILLSSVYIFGYALYAITERHYRWDRLFSQIAVINFIFTLLAIIFYFTKYKLVFWAVSSISANLINFPRLYMFTYEPSYYSVLLAPLFLYFFARLFAANRRVNLQMLLITGLSLILSFSIGVLACLCIAIILFFLVNYLKVLNNKRFRFYLFSLSLLVILSAIGLIIFAPSNPLFIRISNILNHADTSGNARTFEAYQLAYLIAKIKSIWWGVGLGQIKIIGYETIIKFYHYSRNGVLSVAIPCAMAETFAIFGIFGVILRLGVEIYLFFKSKVLQNYYCTLLFFFIFIYQFTGSYITNVAEYTIWILAFSSSSFPEFSKSKSLSPANIIS